MSSKAFLIDGTAFCYRAFYAVRELTTSDGRPTNAVYGFASMLNALRKKHRPDYLAVAFDAGKPTFRHERFKAYKLKRPPMPDLLIGQLPLIKELLAAYRVAVFELEGYEAEDLLATITRRIAARDLEVLLVTGDKDALQLVGPHVKICNPQKEDVIFDEDSVVQRYGVPPDRMVDLMALMGDETDNIPGVPGIGQKTASSLLQRFGSLNGIYEHLDEVESPSVRASLMQFSEQVQLAHQLARIDKEVPIQVELDGLAVREPNWTVLRRLFRRLQFKRLLAEADALAPASAEPEQKVHLVEDQHAAEQLRQALASTQPAAIAHWSLPESPPGVLALAWNSQEAWVVDLSATHPMRLEPLAAWLADANRAKIGHDLKTTMRWLKAKGLVLDGIACDTMIAAYLADPSRMSPSLRDVAEDLCDVRLPEIKAPDLADPASIQAMAQHTCAILKLSTLLEEKLTELRLDQLYKGLELPLISVLAGMESAGVAIDKELLASMRSAMQEKLERLTEEIFRLAGCQFNLNSPKQLAEVLFQRLGLPVVKRTKTGPSTDGEVLSRLSPLHSLPQRLLEYRELAKLVSTYLEALPRLINPATGRIHTCFNQTGTATGRLSSSDPNLQNIPIKTELGRQIRKAIIAGEPGFCLIAADYSQIELRILAHLANDPELIRAFQNDLDIHRHTASLVYGVPEEEVSIEMRNGMKAINYGIIYGMSAHGLSRELGIAHEEASAFIEAYFERYPKVREFLNAQIEQARRDGYVQTFLGRRRYIPEINSPDPSVRQFGERMAVNAPIQGTAADLIKRAMVQLAASLGACGRKSRMILQVHDELVFESPQTELEWLAKLIREAMEHAIELTVPLRVTVKSGPNWLDLTLV